MNNYPFAFDEIFDIDLTGKFVVTGLFTSMRRSDVVHYIYSHGGTVLSAPTRATDYLIVGGEKSKTWKYGQYGTKIRKGLDLREKDEYVEKTLVNASSVLHFSLFLYSCTSSISSSLNCLICSVTTTNQLLYKMILLLFETSYMHLMTACNLQK